MDYTQDSDLGNQENDCDTQVTNEKLQPWMSKEFSF